MNAKPQPRWDDVKLLLQVARSRTFLAAGRHLGIATSTMSRRLTRLEESVGMPLVERRADGVRLTEAGSRLAAAAEDVELALGARLRELPTGNAPLSGVVRVTAGDGFADIVATAIATFAAKHPEVSFDVAIENRAADLVRREADVGIRTMHGREAPLVYTALGTVDFGLFASPGYLARRGTPRALKDLARHSCLGLSQGMDRVAWMRWLAKNGVARFAMRSTSFGALVAAAHAGAGIATLPERLGGDLVRVLPRVRPDRLPVWLASHVESRRRPAVRAFADHLVVHFRAGAAVPGKTS